MAEGRIYISGAFKTVNHSKCGGGVGWLDNDPHFWTQPPTWGICRTDYRRVIKNGDYIFFVLSKASKLPQMIYGYFKVKDKITHVQAFNRPELASKRMGNKNPNGNIIVDANGQYNRFDGGVHKDRFEKIKLYYIIGDESNSEFLTEKKIRQLAPGFLSALNKIFESKESSVFNVIGRSGRRISEKQVNRFLAWLHN
jgi:hypothetical protein